MQLVPRAVPRGSCQLLPRLGCARLRPCHATPAPLDACAARANALAGLLCPVAASWVMEGTQEPQQGCSSPSRDAGAAAGMQELRQGCSSPSRNAGAAAGMQEPQQGCSSPGRDAAAPLGMQPGFQQLCYKAGHCSRGASQEPSVPAAPTTVPWQSLLPGTLLGCRQAGEVSMPQPDGLCP